MGINIRQLCARAEAAAARAACDGPRIKPLPSLRHVGTANAQRSQSCADLQSRRGSVQPLLVVAGPRRIPVRQSLIARDHRAHQRRPFRVWPWRYFVLIARGARGRRSSRRWTAATSRERRTTGGRKSLEESPRRDAVAGTSCFAFAQINTRFPRFHITRALPTRPEASIGPNRPHMALNVRLCRHARRTNTKSLSTRMIEKSRARRVISPLSPFPTRSFLISLPKLLPSYHTTHCCCCLQHFTRDGAYTAPSTGWLGSSLSNVLRCPSIAASVTLSMHAWASLVLPTEPPFPNQPPELHCTLSFFNSVMRSSKTSARRLKFSRRHLYIFTCTRGI